MLEKMGCFAIVLEKVPAALATEIAQSVSVPVIGIGAGGGVDGQVLVTHDMLGMTHEFSPRFLRRYLDLYKDMTNAFGQYVSDVKSKDFPNDSEQYDPGLKTANKSWAIQYIPPPIIFKSFMRITTLLWSINAPVILYKAIKQEICLYLRWSNSTSRLNTGSQEPSFRSSASFGPADLWISCFCAHFQSSYTTQ